MSAVGEASIKRCATCGASKPLDEFYDKQGGAQGKSSVCSACDAASSRPRAAARMRALSRLADAHRAEYERYYAEEKAGAT